MGRGEQGFKGGAVLSVAGMHPEGGAARPLLFEAAASTKASGRSRSSHPGISEQHGFKVVRITADIHLLEVIVPA